MKTLRQIVELALITRPIWGRDLSRRAMSRVVSLLALSVAAGLFGCIVVAGVLYAIYRIGLIYGLTSDGALLVTGACVLASLLVTLVAIRQILYKMRCGSPRLSQVNDILESFLDGLNGKSR